jgi:probable rRNA maturation factor
MNLRVEVQVDDAFMDCVEVELLRRCAALALRHQDIDVPVELTIVVSGEGKVRRLNRQYRGVDAPTDVLAFGSEDDDSRFHSPGIPRYLGDVIISFDQAEAQARRAGHPVEAELQLLTVHGVLHLLGHDHANVREKALMWNAQAEILRELGVIIAYPTPED